jgi:hypothetical protein
MEGQIVNINVVLLVLVLAMGLGIVAFLPTDVLRREPGGDRRQPWSRAR